MTTTVEDVFGQVGQGDIGLVKLTEEGLPTESLAELRLLGLTFAEVGQIVVAPRTVKHRKSRGERLSTEESERLLRVARVLALANRVFGDHDKALRWLREPDPRLNGRSCLSLLRTEAGGKFVENMLWQIDEGMFP